jgi:hypothetical protein
MSVENKQWHQLPTAMSGSSDDKITLVIQWILSGLGAVLPLMAIFSRGRRRRRLLMATFWLMLYSTLLALGQEGQMERFKAEWHKGREPEKKPFTMPSRPKHPDETIDDWLASDRSE